MMNTTVIPVSYDIQDPVKMAKGRGSINKS
jgi:hypothetical protein